MAGGGGVESGRMSPSLFRLALLCTLLGGSVFGQEVKVRTVEKISMPTEADSNSPAFWRDGLLYWYNSHGQPRLSAGPGLAGPWITDAVGIAAVESCPHWMESVWPEDPGQNNNAVWAWYHAEPVGLFEDSTLTAPKIGAMMSLDGGWTFQDLGSVLESGDALDAGAQNGYFAGGHGDFTVIPDEDHQYFYFLFDNYGGAAATQGVVTARMAFADRFTPQGRVWKYYKGDWQEAGIGGKVTPIVPVKRAWQYKDPDAFWGPSVHWNTFLKCYVMLLNHAQGQPGWSQEGVYVSFCSDLSHPETWTQPVKILDKSQMSGWYFFYPQVMGLAPGETDRRVGQFARLFVGGISKWEIEFAPKSTAPTEPVGTEPTTPTDDDGGGGDTEASGAPESPAFAVER